MYPRLRNAPITLTVLTPGGHWLMFSSWPIWSEKIRRSCSDISSLAKTVETLCLLLVALIDTSAALQTSDTACQPEQAYLELFEANRNGFSGDMFAFALLASRMFKASRRSICINTGIYFFTFPAIVANLYCPTRIFFAGSSIFSTPQLAHQRLFNVE